MFKEKKDQLLELLYDQKISTKKAAEAITAIDNLEKETVSRLKGIIADSWKSDDNPEEIDEEYVDKMEEKSETPKATIQSTTGPWRPERCGDVFPRTQEPWESPHGSGIDPQFLDGRGCLTNYIKDVERRSKEGGVVVPRKKEVTEKCYAVTKIVNNIFSDLCRSSTLKLRVKEDDHSVANGGNSITLYVSQESEHSDSDVTNKMIRHFIELAELLYEKEHEKINDVKIFLERAD